MCIRDRPERVFYVGAMGVENLKKVPLMRKLELEDSLNFKFEGLPVMVTNHPVTLGTVSYTHLVVDFIHEMYGSSEFVPLSVPKFIGRCV